jgi:hypothetical protein
MKKIKKRFDCATTLMNIYRYWLAILVSFFFLALWTNLALTQEVQGAKIVLKEDTVDLKEIKEGETIEYAFQVFNQGDQTLEIKDVKPG